MITYRDGNIFEDPSLALVNAVNIVGVMGKGIALQFKLTFPECFDAYTEAVSKNELSIGKVQVVPILQSKTAKYVINFPTKLHWRNPSRLSWIESGLADLKDKICIYNIKSIALPALGCGNGGLHWGDVKNLIEQHLKEIDCDVRVYKPHD